MKRVAKVVLIDNRDRYLIFQRGDHPTFPNDPDLPGGTLEEGEEPLEAMIREVEEEAGIKLDRDGTRLLYQGADYSAHGTQYNLYEYQIDYRPDVIISWEHESYAWVSRQEFLKRAHQAADTYMQWCMW